MQLANSLQRYRVAVLLLCAIAALSACEKSAPDTGQAPAPLATADLDALSGKVTVSGISSGGYMAVQTQVALADRIGGGAAIAAGPYHCAEGGVKKALGPCMQGDGLSIDPLLSFTRENSENGNIASLGALANTRAWIYHSPADAIVSPVAGQALFDFYSEFLPADSVAYVTSIESAHGWPTDSTGVACHEMGGDFVNACDYDAAGEFLTFFYGDLSEPGGGGLSASLQTIDISGLLESGTSVSDTGFAYVPASCAASMQDCKLHIAFHGCRQGAEFIEDRFATQVGLNEWADGNNIVVVYPQIEKSMFNPQGCWDWWGYSGDDYDLKSGKQVVAVNAIIEAFARDELIP